MSGGEKREAIEVILIVRLDAFGEPGIRVARDNQTDQHAVYIHLIPIRRGASTQAAAVRELRVDCRVESNYIAGETVGDRNRPAQVDRLDNIQTWSPKCRHSRVRHAQRLVNT